MPGFPKNISEPTALKREAAYLRKQIRKAEKLLQQRKAVKALQAKLDDIKDRVDHPERYAYEDERC